LFSIRHQGEELFIKDDLVKFMSENSKESEKSSSERGKKVPTIEAKPGGQEPGTVALYHKMEIKQNKKNEK
jgi:hypothetical protein